MGVRAFNVSLRGLNDIRVVSVREFGLTMWDLNRAS